MNSTASFTVNKKELLSALKQLKKLERSGKKKESTLEITVIDSGLQLIIPGVELYIAARTENCAKFTVKLWYITDVVNAENDIELFFTLSINTLKLRGFSFNVQTTFFENDRILRSINLPMNYKYLDIVKLYLSEKYTSEELKFNKLEKTVLDSIDKLKTDIDRVTSILKVYSFSRNEIECFIHDKVK